MILVVADTWALAESYIRDRSLQADALWVATPALAAQLLLRSAERAAEQPSAVVMMRGTADRNQYSTWPVEHFLEWQERTGRR